MVGLMGWSDSLQSSSISSNYDVMSSFLVVLIVMIFLFYSLFWFITDIVWWMVDVECKGTEWPGRDGVELIGRGRVAGWKDGWGEKEWRMTCFSISSLLMCVGVLINALSIVSYHIGGCYSCLLFFVFYRTICGTFLCGICYNWLAV